MITQNTLKKVELLIRKRKLNLLYPKQQGGQKGHARKSLKMVATPNKVEVCLPFACFFCGRYSECKDCIAQLAVRRQVFNVPMPKLKATEYRLGRFVAVGRASRGILHFSKKRGVCSHTREWKKLLESNAKSMADFIKGSSTQIAHIPK